MFLRSLTDRNDGKNKGFLAAKHMGNLPLSQASSDSLNNVDY